MKRDRDTDLSSPFSTFAFSPSDNNESNNTDEQEQTTTPTRPTSSLMTTTPQKSHITSPSQSSNRRSITKLADDTSRSICSAQVIPSLWAAVKELLENALDAGATFVEVRMTNHGTGLVEVRDNGVGMPPERLTRFGNLNITSKISSFEDVAGVTTFGFRGEAVAAMCQICAEMRIVSKQEGAAHATAVTYSRGVVCGAPSTVPLEGEHGTVFRLTDLFDPLTVRRKHFLSRAKKDFSTMLLRLQQYCLLGAVYGGGRQPVRIRVTHNDEAVLAPQASPDAPLSVITSVVGVKTAKTMKLVRWELEVRDGGGEPVVSGVLVGALGCLPGAASSSVQHLYLNSRPVDIPKFAKAVAGATGADRGVPVYVLNLLLTKGRTDVNMTPDKRTVTIESDTALASQIYERVVDFFSEKHTSEQQTNAMEAKTSVAALTLPSLSRANSTPQKRPSHSATTPPAALHSSSPQSSMLLPPGVDIESVLPQYRRFLSHTPTSTAPCDDDADVVDDGTPRGTSHDPIAPETNNKVKRPRDDEDEENEYVMEGQTVSARQPGVSFSPSISRAVHSGDTGVVDSSSEAEADDGSVMQSPSQSCCSSSPDHRHRRESTEQEEEEETLSQQQQQRQPSSSFVAEHSVVTTIVDDYSDDDEDEFVPAVVGTFSIPLESVLAPSADDYGETANNNKHNVQASVYNVVKQDVTRILDVGDFADMRVLGQFNMGFIVTQLGEDLFVVDQHAADEKKNFESLMTTAEQSVVVVIYRFWLNF
eukprot:PhM_4_TR4330/c0_g1_i1/m.73648/K10858/PMS2; DNA mismatch repair protein PMS2